MLWVIRRELVFSFRFTKVTGEICQCYYDEMAELSAFLLLYIYCSATLAAIGEQQVEIRTARFTTSRFRIFSVIYFS